MNKHIPLIIFLLLSSSMGAAQAGYSDIMKGYQDQKERNLARGSEARKAFMEFYKFNIDMCIPVTADQLEQFANTISGGNSGIRNHIPQGALLRQMADKAVENAKSCRR